MFIYIVRRSSPWSPCSSSSASSTFALFYAAPIDPARLTCGKNCTPAIRRGATARPSASTSRRGAVRRTSSRASSSGVTTRTTRQLRKANPETDHPLPGTVPGLLAAADTRSVSSMISEAWPVTLSLAIGAFVLWMVVGVGGGIIAALSEGRFAGPRHRRVALIGFSLPTFFIGLLLLQLPRHQVAAGSHPRATSPFTDNPVAVVPGPDPALDHPRRRLRRQLRPAHPRLHARDHERGLHPHGPRQGRRERAVVVSHGLRAALTPIVTVAGLDLGGLLGGAIITETVFNLQRPGHGRPCSR